MPTLNLEPTHQSVKSYYAAPDQFDKLGVTHETAVRGAFKPLLENCARQCKWTLVPEYGVSTGRGKRIVDDSSQGKDPQYNVKVTGVSLELVGIVNDLSKSGVGEGEGQGVAKRDRRDARAIRPSVTMMTPPGYLMTTARYDEETGKWRGR